MKKQTSIGAFKECNLFSRIHVSTLWYAEHISKKANITDSLLGRKSPKQNVYFL